MNLMLSMRQALAFLLAVLASPLCAQSLNPWEGPDCAEWTQAKAADQRVEALPADNPDRGVLIALFISAQNTQILMKSGSHPLAIELSAYREKLTIYNRDAADYATALQKYKDDAAAYRAAGGGGTYKTDDPRLAMLQAWFARLETERRRLDDWAKRLDATKAELDPTYDALSTRFTAEYDSWKRSCVLFADRVDRAEKRAEIVAQLAEVKRKMEHDRKELSYYQEKVPELHSDIEAMAMEADETRDENRNAAIDKAVGLALDGLISKVDSREIAARGTLRQVKQALIEHGVKPEDVKKVLKGWYDAPNSVQSIRHTKELLERVATLRELAGAYDSTTKRQYLEALATCLGLFVHTPLLKLVVTNFELYSNLMYTGLSYASARARVNQYSKLSETQLVAVAKISALYKTHVRQSIELKIQLEALAEP